MMLKRYLLISCLCFFSFKTFSEFVPEENLDVYLPTTENSDDSYTIIGNPEFDFENLDPNILDRVKKIDTEEETANNDCDEETTDLDPSFAETDMVNIHPYNRRDTFYEYENFQYASNQVEKAEHCDEELSFDVIHNNRIHDKNFRLTHRHYQIH